MFIFKIKEIRKLVAPDNTFSAIYLHKLSILIAVGVNTSCKVLT